MIRGLVFIILSGLVLATAESSKRPIAISAILSGKTSRFLQIFNNGTISANGDLGKLCS